MPRTDAEVGRLTAAPGRNGEAMARPWRTSGSVERRIDAPAEALYDLITDVATTGDRSDECRRAEWLDGADHAAVGARFRGHSRWRLARWTRVCEVIEATPGRAFAFRTVPERWDMSRNDSTIWRYDLVPDGERTLVRHSYEITRLPVQPFRWLYGIYLPQHRDMRPAMTQTLDSLAVAVAARSR
jgi:hypothetical protein